MSSNIDLLKTIVALEQQLGALKEQLGAAGSGLKPEKKKRAVNPDAKPNPWIQFLGRVQAVIKESKTEGPATIGVLFAKSLKDSQENAYELEAGAIADAFTAWATPERIEHAKSLKRTKKEKAEESGDEAIAAKDLASAGKGGEGGQPVPPPKRVLSDEQKAKMKAGREAAKAAKAAAASYTKEQLTDWSTLTIDGEEFGVNVRGDVIDGDGNFAGHWDKMKLNRAAPKPADWDEINA